VLAGVYIYLVDRALYCWSVGRRALSREKSKKSKEDETTVLSKVQDRMKGTKMEGTLNLVGFGLAAIGPGIATGLIFAAYINGVARQPEARSILQPIAFLGFALAEALALFGLVLAFVL
jgi:F-type H+-transporting ATPase subunit c